MKSHNTIAGKIYTVTSPSGCTVTDETGLQLGSVEAGEQKSFVATGAQLSVDDDAARVTLTFNRAASALRLLGGGVKSELPAGYLRAEFLESTGTQCALVPFADNLSNIEFEMDAQFTATGQRQLMGYSNSAWIEVSEGGNFMINNPRSSAGSAVARRVVTYSMEWTNEGRREKITALNTVTSPLITYAFQKQNGWMLCGLIYTPNGSPSFFCHAKIWSAKLKLNNTLFDIVTAIDATGKPCFFDKQSKTPFYNYQTGADFVTGFTLTQARKLGAHLPEGGGLLTISLPTGYEQEAAVTESLETARAKGWTLTIQTYTPEAEAAAATFGMRRVWVRRVQDEQGGYVDAGGVRWSVDWCADMVTPDGSTPDQHGYELYRSTEAAVAYWELQAWTDPEAEQEFLTNQVS